MRSGPLVQLSDAELVKMSQGGNADAYGELINRHQRSVDVMARSLVHRTQIAEDLTQETFLKAYGSLVELRQPDRFGSWVLSILRNTALDYIRTHRNTVSLESLQMEGFDVSDGSAPASGVAGLENQEDELQLLDAIAGLREDYREILVMKHFEDLSYKEISERLNMTVSAVGEKLCRVRSLLKARLEKKSVTY
jgi:RNA polymerase sigma-70 factor, ECF subfamily